MKTQCTCYSVDPAALSAGVPIEQLERRNERVLIEGETLEMLNSYSQRTDRLAAATPIAEVKSRKHSPSRRKSSFVPVPKANGHILLRINPVDYNAAINGRMITVPNAYLKHVGKKFRIVNEQTLDYRVFTLCNLVGNRGYFL